jgi:hypothetical protein
MSAIRRPGHRAIVEELTREGRLSAPLLRQMQEQFDGQDWLDPGLIGRLYEQELSAKKSRQRAHAILVSMPSKLCWSNSKTPVITRPSSMWQGQKAKAQQLGIVGPYFVLRV